MSESKNSINISSLHLATSKSNIQPTASLTNQVEKSVTKKLIIVTILCMMFMLLELTGGFLANSLAIICDGFHLAADLGGFVISLVSTFLAAKAPTRRMNFGFRRIEILGALLSVVFIWLLTGSLLFIAINRIIKTDYEIDAKLMITMAGCGVIINGIMAFVLSISHRHGGIDHHHGHSHQERRQSSLNTPKIIDSKCSISHNKTPSQVSDSKADSEDVNTLVSRNINIRAAFIHIIGDMIQSIGVLLASVIVYFYPKLKIADPICTIVFSFIVLCTTLPILYDIGYVLSESFPKRLEYETLRTKLNMVHGVKDVHYLKVWCLSVDCYALNAHVSVDRDLKDLESLAAVYKNCHRTLREINQFEHMNIQIDFSDLIENECKRNASARLMIPNEDIY